MVKRAVDIVVGAVGLVLLSPLFAGIAVLVKMGSPGVAFYRGVRVGRYGKPFHMLKFRTLVVDAEQIGGSSTADDDPRVTRVGKLLRKYKLDELPQLINVLKGDMSLVGPRPEVPHYVQMFTDEEQAILSVRPGITDWATLWNPDEGAVLAGSADAEKAYMEKIRPTKLRLQLNYVRTQSFWGDIKILAWTVSAILLKVRPDVVAAQGQKG